TILFTERMDESRKVVEFAWDISANSIAVGSMHNAVQRAVADAKYPSPPYFIDVRGYGVRHAGERPGASRTIVLRMGDDLGLDPARRAECMYLRADYMRLIDPHFVPPCKRARIEVSCTHPVAIDTPLVLHRLMMQTNVPYACAAGFVTANVCIDGREMGFIKFAHKELDGGVLQRLCSSTFVEFTPGKNVQFADGRGQWDMRLSVPFNPNNM